MNMEKIERRAAAEIDRAKVRFLNRAAVEISSVNYLIINKIQVLNRYKTTLLLNLQHHPPRPPVWTSKFLCKVSGPRRSRRARVDQVSWRPSFDLLLRRS
jgi:hypothetical protein